MSDASNADGTPAPERLPGRDPPPQRKRFYDVVSVMEAPDGFAIALDSRPARTPKKLPLAVPSKPLADAIAGEWRAQDAVVRPASMPLTTLACTAIDGVAMAKADVAAEIGAYAMSDLLCYRAEAPLALARRQQRAWDPVLAWATGDFGVAFAVTRGLMPVTQDERVRSVAASRVADLDPIRLASVHVLTTLTGSALLALAVLARHIDIDTAWSHAHIDEDWQIEQWGTDAEAEARRRHRRATADAAAKVLELLA